MSGECRFRVRRCDDARRVRHERRVRRGEASSRDAAIMPHIVARRYGASSAFVVARQRNQLKRNHGDCPRWFCLKLRWVGLSRRRLCALRVRLRRIFPPLRFGACPLRWQGVLRRVMPPGNHCLALLCLEEASSRPHLPKADKTQLSSRCGANWKTRSHLNSAER